MEVLMKYTLAAASIAFLASTGVAAADEPVVLDEAQLDRMTAGVEPTFPGVFVVEVPGPEEAPPPPGDLVIQFEVHPTQAVMGILQNSADPRLDAADPGFHLDPPRPILSGRVHNPD
jgi:hypothetical protein